jgi:hypothetical protein
MGQAFHNNGQHRGRRESPRWQLEVRVTASSREILMGMSRSIPCVLVLVSSVVTTWAADSIEMQSSSVAMEALQPWIHGGMNNGLRDSVEVAFEIAAQRVQEVETCSDLFTELGVDAMETRDRAVYMPVFSSQKVQKVCGRNLAYTFVGAPSTFICPKFERVSDQHAAMVLIHEALHTAGLEEAPTTPGAKTSQQINSMVAKSCHF